MAIVNRASSPLGPQGDEVLTEEIRNTSLPSSSAMPSRAIPNPRSPIRLNLHPIFNSKEIFIKIINNLSTFEDQRNYLLSQNKALTYSVFSAIEDQELKRLHLQIGKQGRENANTTLNSISNKSEPWQVAYQCADISQYLPVDLRFTAFQEVFNSLSQVFKPVENAGHPLQTTILRLR